MFRARAFRPFRTEEEKFWDPAISAPSMAFLDSNKTVYDTLNSSWNRCYANIVFAPGDKVYWEVDYINDAPFTLMYGVGEGGNLTIHMGGSTGGIGWYTSNGNVYSGGGVVGTLTPYPDTVTRKICGIAIDYDNSKIWFRAEEAWPGGQNPATNTLGLTYYYNVYGGLPGISPYAYLGQFTLRSLASEMAFSVPDGFKVLAAIGV